MLRLRSLTTPLYCQCYYRMSGQRPLMEFLLEANTSVDCTQTVIYPTPVVETAYVTLTPDVLTAFVTLTPDVVTDYVTLTPEIQVNYVTLTPDVLTAYVTVTPEVHTAYVTVSPEVQTAYVTVPAEVHTAYVTVTPSALHDVTTKTVEQMVTVTTSLSQSCSPAELTVTAALITTTVPLTHTETLTQTRTATVTATATLSPTSTFCPPQPSASACPNVTNTESDNHHQVDDRAESDVLRTMQSVVKELTVNPSNVSRSRRRKESAPDERTSAQTMGITAILMMVLPVALVTLLDLPSLYRDIQRLHHAAHDTP